MLEIAFLCCCGGCPVGVGDHWLIRPRPPSRTFSFSSTHLLARTRSASGRLRRTRWPSVHPHCSAKIAFLSESSSLRRVETLRQRLGADCSMQRRPIASTIGSTSLRLHAGDRVQCSGSRSGSPSPARSSSRAFSDWPGIGYSVKLRLHAGLRAVMGDPADRHRVLVRRPGDRIAYGFLDPRIRYG